MGNLDKLTKLKKKAEAAQREADKAQGALEQILSQLKEEFKCDSLEDAEYLLATLHDQERLTLEAFDEAMTEFEKRYGDKISG